MREFLHLIAWLFMAPGDLIADQLGITHDSNRELVRMLINSLFWIMVVVLCLAIWTSTLPPQQFVDGLAAAGFAKADMQMTADRTTVNLTPGSVQFSVLINGGCLIGQFGEDIGGYHSMVAPVLRTGKCLIGDTVPIQ